MADILFAFFWCVCAFFGLMAVIHPKPVYNAISMAIAIIGLAAIYIFLGYDFMAALQILVYFGAISVAIIFVVMLSPLARQGEERPRTGKVLAGGAAALTFLAVFATLLYGRFGAASLDLNRKTATMKQIGRLLATRYAIPFELISVVLLVAILGAIILARKEKEQ